MTTRTAVQWASAWVYLLCCRRALGRRWRGAPVPVWAVWVWTWRRRRRWRLAYPATELVERCPLTPEQQEVWAQISTGGSGR